MKSSKIYLTLLVLVLFFNLANAKFIPFVGNSSVSVETLDDTFNFSDYKSIYVIDDSIDKNANGYVNQLSGITKKKILNEVVAMLKKKGYKPTVITSVKGINPNIPIAAIRMWETYYDYETSGYTYTTSEYQPGKTYTVNSYSNASAYGSGGYAYGYGSTYGTVHESGQYVTKQNYVPGSKGTGKVLGSYVSFYKNGENIANMSASVANPNSVANYKDIGLVLFDDLFYNYIPFSKYTDPTVVYFKLGSEAPDWTIEAGTQYEQKGVKVLRKKAKNKKQAELYVYRGDSNLVVDMVTTLVVLYPFSGKMDNIYVKDKNNNTLEVKRNDFEDYAMVYFPYDMSSASYKEIVSTLK